MSYQQVADGQVNPEVPINENMAALGQEFVFSHDVTADSGLVVGINGGNFDANTVADTTVTATNNTTNYIVMNRSTRAVSTATSTTNWNNTITYGRIGRAVFAAGVLTYYDERSSAGGVFDHSVGGAVLADGDYGDIVVSSSGTSINIDSGVLSTFGRTVANAANASAARTVLGLGTSATLDVDTDTAMAANSDTRVPSQKAVAAYIASFLSNFDTKPECAYASTSALPANTYSNGTSGVGATLTGNVNGPLVIDGRTLVAGAVGLRILVGGEGTDSHNGWFTLTQLGVVAVSPYILTRDPLSDQAAEIAAGYLTAVKAPSGLTAGSSNDGKLFISVCPSPFTVGTSSLTFTAIGAASGSVTTVSVVTANGVSGSVANPSTTPAITLTLGAITPTSVAASGSVTGSNLSGTNTGDETTTTTGTLIHGATAKTALVDADEMDLTDSAASFVMKKITWANVKATLKTYFDTLYASVTQPFDVHAYYPGIPTASAKVVRVPIARAVTFAANFSGSYFAASANATATTVFDVQKNGSSIGSISIAASGTTATFTTTSGTSKSFAAGDVLMIVCPASPDTTLADPGFVLVGTR